MAVSRSRGTSSPTEAGEAGLGHLEAVSESRGISSPTEACEAGLGHLEAVTSAVSNKVVEANWWEE